MIDLNIKHRMHSLSYLVEKYQRGDLQIPDFQRELVWDKYRMLEWAKAIRGEAVPASIYIYQLPSSNVFWLADGCQRLYTTIRILNNPSAYEFLGADELQAFTERCEMPWTIVQLKTHLEGYALFIKLNSLGTGLNDSELHKGALVYDNPLGAWLYENLDSYIKPLQYSTVRPKKLNSPTRDDSNIRIRSNLALFAQYITRTDTTRFWDIQIKGARVPKHVEQIVADAIASMTEDTLKKHLSAFRKFLAGYNALIRKYIDEDPKKGQGYAISDGLWRHLMHLAVFARNTNWHNSNVEKYFVGVINHSTQGNSKLHIVFNGEELYRTPATYNLSHASDICRLFGIEWNSREKRKKRQQLIEGYEHSHIEPFSIYGEGETFPEPAPLNRSRGSKPVTTD